MRAMAAKLITQSWKELQERAFAEMGSEGIPIEEIKFKKYAYIKYMGQFQDHETESPVEELTSIADTMLLINAFEDIYGRKYPVASKYPEAGYFISELAVNASFALPKPILKKRPLEDEKPLKETFKGKREVYYKGQWIEFDIWEMDMLNAGNVVRGPAIIEHPATTQFIPPDRKVRFDEYRIIHYS
jgi:N-methylhydantoinase A/oxoprolinase/acetone carboxylase beta subunit